MIRVRVTEVLCRKQGLTMRQLAEEIGVDYQTVLYWNQGRSFPRLPMLLKLCRMVGCSLDDMIESSA